MNRIRTNNLLKKTLYQLKKWHGMSVDLYLRGTVSQNVETFVVTFPEVKWMIKRAPVTDLKTVVTKTDAQNFAVAGRSFEFGGHYTLSQTVVIVEIKDLPTNYAPNKTDSFVIDHKRYAIVDFHNYIDKQAVIFVIEHLSGQKTNEIFSVRDGLSLTEGVSA